MATTRDNDDPTTGYTKKRTSRKKRVTASSPVPSISGAIDQLQNQFEKISKDLEAMGDQPTAPSAPVPAKPKAPPKSLCDSTGYAEPPWWPTLQFCMDKDLPVLLAGPSGTGKTLAIVKWAERTGRKLYVQQGYRDLTSEEVRGAMELIPRDGATITHHVDGQLTRSLRDPTGVFLFDEITCCPPDVLPLMNMLLDGHRVITIPGTGEKVTRPRDWRFASTQNPGYLGTGEVPESLLSRCVRIECGALSGDMERDILMDATGIDRARATALVEIGQAVRSAKAQGDHEFDCCVRTLLQAAWYIQAPVGKSSPQTLLSAFDTIILPKIGMDPVTAEAPRKGIRKVVRALLDGACL